MPTIHDRLMPDDIDASLPLEFGNRVAFRLGDLSFGVQVQRGLGTIGNETVPLTSTLVTVGDLPPGQAFLTDLVGPTTRTFCYRGRHIRDGWDPGPFTGYACAIPELLTDRGDPIGWDRDTDSEESRGRGDSLWEQDRTLRTDVTTLGSGGALFPLASHGEAGTNRDGDTIVFSQVYHVPPQVAFFPQCALMFDSGQSGSDQFIDIKAENLTVSGFDLRAKITVGPTATTFNDGWSTAQNVAAPENNDVVMNGGTGSTDVSELFSNLEDTSSGAAISYDSYFDINATPMGENSAVVKLFYNLNTTSTSFTLAASKTYSNTDNVNDQKITATSVVLGSSFDLRMTLTYQGPFAPATSELAVVTAHGEGHATFPGVQFSLPTGGTSTSMTPGVGDRIAWVAIGANETT